MGEWKVYHDENDDSLMILEYSGELSAASASQRISLGPLPVTPKSLSGVEKIVIATQGESDAAVLDIDYVILVPLNGEYVRPTYNYTIQSSAASIENSFIMNVDTFSNDLSQYPAIGLEVIPDADMPAQTINIKLFIRVQ